MGYEPHSKRVWYRRGASGVRTTLRNMYGTGEGPLVYKPHSETCSVQERGLWGTNRTPKRVRYRRWASGYEPHSKRVRYRRGASGVQNESKENAGTRET